MKYLWIVLLSPLLSFTARAETHALPLPSSLVALQSECRRVEEHYSAFACLKFEFFQSSSRHLEAAVAEIVDIRDYNLQPSSWSQMLSYLMTSMDAQIYRYQDPQEIAELRRLKAKNQWELLKLKEGLKSFWFDPHTYWYPSVDAISFVAVNPTTSQILVISHGERN